MALRGCIGLFTFGRRELQGILEVLNMVFRILQRVFAALFKEVNS